LRPYPTPRFQVPATDRPSYGGSLVKAAEALGVPFMGWQEHVATVALEHEDGQLAYRDVIVSTPGSRARARWCWA
jgi:hypothetical protein